MFQRYFIVVTLLLTVCLSANTKPIFTLEEKIWIEQNQNVVVAGEFDWAPYYFVGKDKVSKGFVKDYLDLISQKSGLRFSYEVDTWHRNLQKIKDQEVDLIPALYKTKEREQQMLFTNPYRDTLEYFYIHKGSKKKSLDQLIGTRIAVIRGYANEKIIKDEFPNLLPVHVNSFSEAVALVLDEKAELLFDEQQVIQNYIEKNSIDKLIALQQYEGSKNKKLYMAVSSSKPILQAIINKTLQTISKQEQEALEKRWIYNGEVVCAESSLEQEDRQWQIALALLVLLVVSFFIFTQRSSRADK